MSLPLTGPHWDFAVSLYRSEGVAEACLELQDSHGIDVPVLLAALFAARNQGAAVEAADISAADAVVRPWRDEVVAPLRLLRRRLKLGFEAIPIEQAETVRTSIKETELHAEQLQIAVLAQWFASLAPRRIGDHVDLAAVAMRVVEVYKRPEAKLTRSDLDPLVDRIATAAARYAAHW